MTTVLRPAAFALATLSLAGCISFGAEPPESLLTLTATTPVSAERAASGTAANALTIEEINAPQKLSVTRVPVQIDASNVAYLQNAQWVERPTRLFQNLLAETIRARSGRLVLSGADPSIVTDTQLRGRLMEFGYDVATSSVIVRYDAIREGQEGRLDTRRFEASVPGVVAEAGPVGDALNRAANDVAQQVADWIG